MYKAIKDKVIVKIIKEENKTDSGIILNNGESKITYTVVDAIDYKDLIGKNIEMKDGSITKLGDDHGSVSEDDIVAIKE